MDQIKIWRDNKNQISQHKIKIGMLNEQIGELKEKVGLQKEEIAICENTNRETPYYWVSQWVSNNIASYMESFDDSVSQGQYESKLWLIETVAKMNLFNRQPIKIEIIGSWFGFPLIEMLNKIFTIEQIDLYDIDKNCHKVVAQYVNHFDYDFKIAQYENYFDRKELRRRHIIINTASEHMNDIVEMKSYYKNYPEMPLIILQSNNYFDIDDHVNCVNHEDELADKNDLFTLYYKGKTSLPLYDRYMVIGRWSN